MSKKGVWDFILFRSWVSYKNQQELVSTHSFFTLLLITQDINKIKKSHKSFSRYYYIENVCKISAKNIKVGVGARQNFPDKKPGFLEIIAVCLNLGIRFYIIWLALPNY